MYWVYCNYLHCAFLFFGRGPILWYLCHLAPTTRRCILPAWDGRKFFIFLIFFRFSHCSLAKEYDVSSQIEATLFSYKNMIINKNVVPTFFLQNNRTLRKAYALGHPKFHEESASSRWPPSAPRSSGRHGECARPRSSRGFVGIENTNVAGFVFGFKKRWFTSIFFFGGGWFLLIANQRQFIGQAGWR